MSPADRAPMMYVVAARLHIAFVPAVLALCAALAAPDGAGAAVGLERVSGTFDLPVHVTAPPGDGRRLMVTQQGGSVRVVRDGKLLAGPFLKISSNFDTGGERGLLSLAFPPDYERTRFVYAYYTDGDGDIRVDQFRRSAGSRDHVEPGYRRNVIEVLHREAGNHNGGLVTFGPDGHMYLGTGDGGNGYDTPTRDASNTGSLLGKILRIDPLPGGGHVATPGNPFGNAVYAYGLRNPFRFAFDRANGDLSIGDVGQNTVEEIDHAPTSAGRGRGANFGWDVCEGNVDVSGGAPGGACTLSGDAPPAITHTHGEGFCSITGGVVVRDPSVEELRGRYLYGDLCRGHLRSAQLGAGGASGDREESSLSVSQVVDVGEDACGRVYTVEHAAGRVSRLRDQSPGGCALRVLETVAAKKGALAARALRRQRVLKKRRLAVRVRCSRPCSLRVLGALSVVKKGKRRSLKLRQVKHKRVSGSLALRVPIGRRGRRYVRRTLRAKKKVTAKLVIRARDASGRLSVVRLRVRIVG